MQEATSKQFGRFWMGETPPGSLPSGSPVTRPRPRPLLLRLWRYLRTTATEVIHGEKSAALDLELPARYRPATIPALCSKTGFTKAEVKRLYWSFKNECPTGLVTQENFHAIFSKFFPTGANLSSYPNLVFSTLDRRRTGVITFEDFAVGLATLLHGSPEERLRWTFDLYDVDKDGLVSRAELREVTAAVFDLMGHPGGEREKSTAAAAEQLINSKADLAFQRLDWDQDGVVSQADFLAACLDSDNKCCLQSLETVNHIRII